MPPYLVVSAFALGTEAADGPGVTLTLHWANGLGKCCNAVEQCRGLGFQLKGEVVQNARAVLRTLFGNMHFNWGTHISTINGYRSFKRDFFSPPELLGK